LKACINEKLDLNMLSLLTRIFVNLLKSMRLEDRDLLRQYSYYLLFFGDKFIFKQKFIEKNTYAVLDHILVEINNYVNLDSFSLDFDKIVIAAFDHNSTNKSIKYIDFKNSSKNPNIAKLNKYFSDTETKIENEIINKYLENSTKINCNTYLNIIIQCNYYLNYIIIYTFFKNAEANNKIVTEDEYRFLCWSLLNRSSHSSPSFLDTLIVQIKSYSSNTRFIDCVTLKIIDYLVSNHSYFDLSQHFVELDPKDNNLVLQCFFNNGNKINSYKLKYFFRATKLLANKDEYIQIYFNQIVRCSDLMKESWANNCSDNYIYHSINLDTLLSEMKILPTLDFSFKMLDICQIRLDEWQENPEIKNFDLKHRRTINRIFSYIIDKILDFCREYEIKNSDKKNLYELLSINDIKDLYNFATDLESDYDVTSIRYLNKIAKTIKMLRYKLDQYK
jgi:hypothetical protein